MAKVVGIGGIFFKSPDPNALFQWYQTYLGVDIDSSYGGVTFLPTQMPVNGATIWSAFQQDTQYFQPSSQPFMMNLVVDDIEGVIAQVTAGGAVVHGEIALEEGLGKFAWFSDPDGNKIELWQPL